MAYNTNNPLGSKDPKDLYDNATNFDLYSNGLDPMYPNRFGALKLSIEGMNQQFNDAQDGREAAFEALLEASAFVFIGDYGTGLNFTSRSQYMIRDGVAYRVAPATTLPYTTTGNWALESANFTPISSDDILRQDLANPATGSAIIAKAQQVVNSIVELQALATNSASQYAQTTGYYAEGDGGWGSYFARPSGAGLTPNDVTVFLAADGGFWCLTHNGTINVKQAGAKGDGATDDSAAFQRALDAVRAVYMPSAPNGYRITAQISMNQSGGVLFGDGPSQSSYFNLAAHTFDVIKVNAFNVVIRDIGFQNFTTPAFSAPRFWTIINDDSPGTSVLNIVTYGMHSGISMGAVGSISGGSVSRLHNLILSSLGRGTGIGIQYGGQAEIREMTDIFMSGTGVGTVAGNNAFAGVNILGGVGLVMHNVHLTGCGTPMRIVPPTGAVVNHVKITESWFDSSSASGAELNGTTGTITDVQMSQIWASGCGAGVSILGYARDVVIDNLECYQNTSTGVSVANAASIAGFILSNANISGNAAAGVSFGTNVTGFKVVNSNIGVASFAGANLYGIFLSAGCDGYVITGCDIRGNTTAQISGHAATTPMKRVNDVIGYPTQSMGALSGTTDGSGLFTIPHALGKTPNYISMQPVGGAATTALIAQFASHDATNLNGKLFNNGSPALSTPFTVFWEVKF